MFPGHPLRLWRWVRREVTRQGAGGAGGGAGRAVQPGDVFRRAAAAGDDGGRAMAAADVAGSQPVPDAPQAMIAGIM